MRIAIAVTVVFAGLFAGDLATANAQAPNYGIVKLTDGAEGGPNITIRLQRTGSTTSLGPWIRIDAAPPTGVSPTLPQANNGVTAPTPDFEWLDPVSGNWILAKSISCRVPAGQTYIDLSIRAIDDSLVEGTEYVDVSIYRNPAVAYAWGVIAGQRHVVASIADND